MMCEGVISSPEREREKTKRETGEAKRERGEVEE